MDQQKTILQLLHRSPEPLGWHGIATRLGNQGIIPSGNLVATLRELVQQGFLIHSQAAGHPHGVYSLTDLGRSQLGV
jgi:DNA-binding HxlR family transcriptional regulator